MANSKVVFEFDGTIPVDGQFIRLKAKNLSTSLITNWFTETYNTAGRTGNYLLPIPTASGNTVTDIQNLTADYWWYFDIDYSATQLFTTTKDLSLGTVTVTLKEGWIFENVETDANGVTFITSNSTDPVSDFDFVQDLFLEADTNPCNYVKISLQTTNLAKKITLNDVEIEADNTNNPVEVSVLRGQPNRIVLEDANGFILEYPYIRKFYGANNFLQHSLLSVSNIEVTVNNSLSGATVSVVVSQNSVKPVATNSNVTADPDLVLEYRLENTSWGDVSVFTGQGEGNGTVYVRDQFGCEKSVDYSITGIDDRAPFLFLSKANPVDFVVMEDIDDCSVFKNSENSFSCEGLTSLKYGFPHLFRNCDKTKVQFKSNFAEPIITLRKEDGTETGITPTLRTSNLDRYMKMDCIYYNYKSGIVGIFFNDGDTYDEVGSVIVGGEYTLNGNLPDFAIIGQYVEIDGLGVYEIKDVIFDAERKKNAILIEHSYTGNDVISIATSVYDLLEYEVWDFEIDWSLYGNGIYDIVIEDEVSLVSENIEIADSHPNTLAITYFNNNNRDIFYKFNQQNFIRVPYLHIEELIEDESEVSKGDLIVNLTSSSVREQTKFFFGDLTAKQMVKLGIALSCENLYINGIGYAKGDSLEVENISNTNLYELNAVLTKTNINYNNNRQGQLGVDFDYIDFNIPALITSGEGFINT